MGDGDGDEGAFGLAMDATGATDCVATPACAGKHYLDAAALVIE